MKTIAKLNQQDREEQAQHTPGPWTREPDARFKLDGTAVVKGPNGIFVACALDFNSFDRDAEVEANARLIAAAPELLAALESMLGDAIKGQAHVTSMTQARAAIAKAKGEVVP